MKLKKPIIVTKITMKLACRNRRSLRNQQASKVCLEVKVEKKSPMDRFSQYVIRQLLFQMSTGM